MTCRGGAVAVLSPAALSSLQRLVAGTRPAGATQPRNGFTYLLRIGGRSITTVDGQLTALDRRLGRLEHRMLLARRVIARSG
jgi:hypothetical protein